MLWALTQTEDGSVSKIKEILNMKSNEFSPYRERLIRKGVILGEDRGNIRFTLPLFAEYVKEHTFFENEN